MSTIIPEDKHRQILETCVDVPDELPSFPIPISRVGITGKTVWVRMLDNNGGHLPFNAKILVNLDANRRGIHMSRIEQEITSLHDMEFASLPEYGKLLSSRILALQNTRYVSIELAGQLPFIQQTPVSRLNSIDSIEVSFKTELEKKDSNKTIKTQIGVGMHHLTACPCTISYNEALFNRLNDSCPPASHSQRSKTQILVSPATEKHLPSYQDLIDILDSALHISQDLLKRPDETELVLKAHRFPQFAEDTVREVARAAGEKLNGILPPETQIQVHSCSLESIHIHDVECYLDTNLGHILTILQSTIKE